MKRHLISAIGTLLLAVSISAAPGDLDPTFGNGGVVISGIGGFSVSPRTILVQPDGKIVVCGMIYDDADNDEAFFLARYHPTGALDTSFGTGGKIISPSFPDVYTGKDIALQPDGKSVAVGFSNGFAVQRYNADGSLDASFGTGGSVTTRVGSGFETAESVAIQTDGKIVVVGYTNASELTSSDFAVVRYNPDGSLDTSFGAMGKIITSIGNYSDSADKVLLQPDGKIVVAGTTFQSNQTSSFVLVRFNANGSLDSGFGAGGKVIHAVSTGLDFMRDAALQPNGQIVVTGWTGIVGATTRSAVVRYNPNGSIDASFAANGIFLTEANFNIGNSIVVQSNGKIAAFGYAVTGLAIARLNPNGTLDTGFGTNGRTIRPNLRAVADGAVQSDGKLLAVGGGYMTNSIEIVRHLGDAVFPRPVQFDFDGDRRADLSVFRPSDRFWYLNQSTNGSSATQFGFSNDHLTPADFDGDGKTDISVYRDGAWYRLNSSNGTVDITQFGLAGDKPVPADYTGDGRSELAVFRNGAWWTQNLANDEIQVFNFGLAADKPVPADFDGDGRVDQAVYRNGEWHINRSANGYTVLFFGLPTDRPLIGDFDGDLKSDLAVYRDGTWYLQQSTAGFGIFNWGLATDVPVPGDYDGDGRTDAAVFRGGTWYLRQTTNGVSIQQFGLGSDTPVPSAYLP